MESKKKIKHEFLERESMSIVAVVPDPDDVVAIAVPVEYPVPAVARDPRVAIPDALALVIVITSDAA